jgi:hypothetical protein
MVDHRGEHGGTVATLNRSMLPVRATMTQPSWVDRRISITESPLMAGSSPSRLPRLRIPL